ncbi:MAG TPA: C39 family peptidase [Aggregatilineales bacterium]|nr:C39 family peptidase [Aggregatilineales bacterium]
MKSILIMIVLLLIAGPAALAQEQAQEPQPLPVSYQLQGVRYEAQGWNNCGPATLTSALSYFGYADNQNRAAAWLKPNNEDKNVSPWQMVAFVNTQIPEIPVYALERHGGTLDLLKLLVANNFPVIIEAGYDPEPNRLGWMGHYLFVKGYDDSTSMFITNDSYLGENVRYPYADIFKYWQHFNYTYMVLYDSGREPELFELLGSDADRDQNILNALQLAAQEANVDRSNAFAWFNLGTNLTLLGEYQRAALAYDEAFKAGLPWRMLWYQFGPFEAYNAVGRYNDTLQLAQRNLNDGGGQYVEETFYYGAVARQGLGQIDRAVDNLRGALAFNPNFTPATELLNALTGSTQ